MTDRQTDKQNGMTIRLTLCERDVINTSNETRFAVELYVKWKTVTCLC